MNIPDKAVEAASGPIYDYADELGWADREKALDIARKAVEAAAPYIRAEALRDAAFGFSQTDPIDTALGGMDYPLDWLKARADELDPS